MLTPADAKLLICPQMTKAVGADWSFVRCAADECAFWRWSAADTIVREELVTNNGGQYSVRIVHKRQPARIRGECGLIPQTNEDRIQ